MSDVVGVDYSQEHLDELVGVYGVFHSLESPETFFSENGTRVFTRFIDAWDEVQSPFYGERKIYRTFIPRVLILSPDGTLDQRRPWIQLRVRTGGWKLLTADDLVVMRVENRLAAESMNEREYRNEDSWLSEMRKEVLRTRSEHWNFQNAAVDELARALGMKPKVLETILLTLPLIEGEKLFQGIHELFSTWNDQKIEIRKLRYDLEDFRREEEKRKVLGPFHPDELTPNQLNRNRLPEEFLKKLVEAEKEGRAAREAPPKPIFDRVGDPGKRPPDPEPRDSLLERVKKGFGL